MIWSINEIQNENDHICVLYKYKFGELKKYRKLRFREASLSYTPI